MSGLFRYPVFYCIIGGGAAALFDNIRHSFWWGFLILGGLICIYGWLAKGARDVGRYEVGDNCYFIGFIYTLIVIALSVGVDARSFLSADNEELAATDDGLQLLLETVGVALGTSVMGMLWRVGLTHGIKIPENELDRIISRASVAANSLEASVSAAGAAAATADKSLRSVSDATQIYADKMRAEADNIGGHLTQVAGKMFDDFGNRIADTLQKTQFDNVREELQEAVEAHRAAADAVSSLMKQSAAELSSVAQATVRSAESAAATMKILQESVGGMQAGEVNEAVINFAEQTQKISEGFKQIAEQQSAMVAAADVDVAKLRAARELSETLMQTLRDDINSATTIKEDYRRAFEQAAKDALTETHALYARLIVGAEMALSSSDEIRALSENLKTIAAQMPKEDK